jgi:hypothetical protein
MFKIEAKASKSGKRTVYFATVNGKRLTSTNFSRKWEAKRVLKDLVAKYGQERLLEMAA